MVQEPQINIATLSQVSARKAARDAANNFEKQGSNSAIGKAGAFALYTWGSLALASVIFAGFMGLSPELVVSKQPMERMASASPADYTIQTSPDIKLPRYVEGTSITPPQQQIAAIDQDILQNVDTMSTGSINPVAGSEDVSQPSMSLGVNIGHSPEVNKLLIRYKALSNRAPEIFRGLEPLLQSGYNEDNTQTSLIMGPFSSQSQLATFCREIRLRLTIDCTQAKYQGNNL